MQTIQEIIKELRELGFTQTSIAEQINAPQPRISRWEGGAYPFLNDALKLKELLDTERRKKSQRVSLRKKRHVNVMPAKLP